MAMRVVLQTDQSGCAAACLAIILDSTYEAAKERFPKKDFTRRGTTVISIDRQLVRAGFSIERRFQERGEYWPPEPWAEAHLCLVHPVENERGCNHWVVMDRTGKVFDPCRKRLCKLSTYGRVLHVAAVHPVARV
jgi:hypothetical protein